MKSKNVWISVLIVLISVIVLYLWLKPHKATPEDFSEAARTAEIEIKQKFARNDIQITFNEMKEFPEPNLYDCTGTITFTYRSKHTLPVDIVMKKTSSTWKVANYNDIPTNMLISAR